MVDQRGLPLQELVDKSKLIYATFLSKYYMDDHRGIRTCVKSHTTRYVIYFHGNLSRFFPHWHFSTLFTSSKSFIHVFSTPVFFHIFFQNFSTWIFHILSTLWFFTFSSHFVSSFFPHFFYEFFFTFFSRYFPHFSLVIFSTFFSHYFFHSFSTLFPCVIIFHAFPMLFFSTYFSTLFFSQFFHNFPMLLFSTYFSHFSHSIKW